MPLNPILVTQVPLVVQGPSALLLSFKIQSSDMPRDKVVLNPNTLKHQTLDLKP